MKGTIIGIGVVTGLALKKMCKMKKLNDQKDKTEYKNEISWVVDLKRFKWKCRILLLNTTCYRDSNYKRSKELYQEYIKEFHKRHVKLISNRKKGFKFSIKLIGYDGILKKEFDTLVPKDIFELIDSMPMSNELKSGKIQPLNLSLYSDYKPETTLKGLGFKAVSYTHLTLPTICSV